MIKDLLVRVLIGVVAIGAAGQSGAFVDHRLSTVSSSWPDVPGDRQYAPIQRNFGDYIMLAADGLRGIAAWTDGRSGAPRIVVRAIEVVPDEGR